MSNDENNFDVNDKPIWLWEAEGTTERTFGDLILNYMDHYSLDVQTLIDLINAPIDSQDIWNIIDINKQGKSHTAPSETLTRKLAQIFDLDEGTSENRIFFKLSGSARKAAKNIIDIPETALDTPFNNEYLRNNDTNNALLLSTRTHFFDYLKNKTQGKIDSPLTLAKKTGLRTMVVLGWEVSTDAERDIYAIWNKLNIEQENFPDFFDLAFDLFDTSKRVPYRKEGWLSRHALTKHFVGHNTGINPKIYKAREFFIDEHLKEFPEENRAEAESFVNEHLIGPYRESRGLPSLYSSPEAIKRMVEMNILQPYEHFDDAPKGWITPFALMKQEGRGSLKYYNRIFSDLLNNMTKKKTSDDPLIVGLGYFRSKQGQISIHAGPEAIQTLKNLKLITPKSKEKWLASKGLSKIFRGNPQQHKKTLEKHHTDSVKSLSNLFGNENARKYVENNWIEYSTPKSGQRSLRASPEFISMLEKNGELIRKKDIDSAPDNWLSAKGFTPKGYIGGNQKFSKLISSLQQILKEQCVDESLVHEHFVGTYKPQKGGSKETLFVNPKIIELLEYHELIYKKKTPTIPEDEKHKRLESIATRLLNGFCESTPKAAPEP